MIPLAERKPELEKYELFEEIGHGGMATVYRGYDRRLDRQVAIKIIHRHLRENKEVAARFVSEARAVAKVKHPNIVEVYDVSEPGDLERYLVVEFVQGTTLRRLLSDTGHMPAEVAAAVAIEIANGLEHAHEHGVVHRDVKPENVLVESPGAVATKRSNELAASALVARIKITDFGIAKLLDAQGVTSTGQVLGSPAHMSPEQIEGGDVSARSDVFGLGVLLYECMVGKLPFDGNNPAQVLRRVLDGAFTPADRARPTVGAGWSRILARALAHESSDRYASCEELAQALRAELTRLGFDEPRRELDDYLVNPEAYRPVYEQRIVARLVDLGSQARADRDAALAADCFNRALAFRPDDTELLAQVAGLARSQRLRRVMLRASAIGVITILIGIAVFSVSRIFRPVPPYVLETSGDVETRPAVLNPRAEARGATAKARNVERRPANRTQENARRGLRTLPLPAAKETRNVRIHIGPAFGKLKIDGVEKAWWGGIEHELEVGPHLFEYVPPNDECCVADPPAYVEVKPGEGAQSVRGEIRFKPATLTLSAPAGSEASCSSLAIEKLSVGTAQAVQMSSSQLEGSCTVFPPATAGVEPKTQPVTLRPGATTVLSWP